MKVHQILHLKKKICARGFSGKEEIGFENNWIE